MEKMLQLFTADYKELQKDYMPEGQIKLSCNKKNPKSSVS